jgi:hypothetical protein
MRKMIYITRIIIIIITSSNQNKKKNAINAVKVGPQAIFAIQNQTISKNQETTDELIMHK